MQGRYKAVSQRNNIASKVKANQKKMTFQKQNSTIDFNGQARTLSTFFTSSSGLPPLLREGTNGGGNSRLVRASQSRPSKKGCCWKRAKPLLLLLLSFGFLEVDVAAPKRRLGSRTSKPSHMNFAPASDTFTRLCSDREEIRKRHHDRSKQ